MRFLGWIFAALGVAAAVLDYGATGADGFRMRSIGETWFALDRESWLVLQPAIERHIHEDLWFSFFEPLSHFSAAGSMFTLALAFWVLGAVFSGGARKPY